MIRIILDKIDQIVKYSIGKELFICLLSYLLYSITITIMYN